MPFDYTELGPSMIPGQPISLAQFVQVVRNFLRDKPELNRLIQGEEHSDRLIAWAVIDAIDDYNTTPPFSGHSFGDFPSKSLLLRGTTINLLESVGLLMTRNSLPFSDGGIQVNLNEKTPLIQSWISLFANRYEAKKREMKIAINLENGWGSGVHSEYLWTNGFYGGW